MSETQKAKKNLISLIRKLAYKEGDFTLASGQKSTFYVDIKNLSLHPLGAKAIAENAWTQLNPKDFDGVGGPTLGADPMATAISLKALELGVELPAFIIRKEAKSHGTTKMIEGADNLKQSARLLILEDVVTTGGSSLKGIEVVRAAGFKVDTLLCVLDRHQGGKETLEKAKVKLVSLTTIDEIKNYS